MTTSYTSISHVAFGDSWSAASHNLLIDNAAALFSVAAQYSVPYFASTTTMAALALALGQVPMGGATVPVAAYPPGIGLWPELEAYPPFSGIAAATIETVESTGAGTQKGVIPRINFAATPDQARIFITRLKNSPAAAPFLKIAYSMSTSVGSAALKWAVYCAMVSSTDTGFSAKVVGTVNNQTDTPPATSDVVAESSVTLTNFDSGAKGDWALFYIKRDTSVGSNHTGVARVHDVEFMYG